LIKKLFKEGALDDVFLTNSIIDELSVYEVILTERERVNYHNKSFSDPELDSLFLSTYRYFDSGKLNELFKIYREDKQYIYCFDLQHLILSVPFRKLYDMRHLLTNTDHFDASLQKKLDDIDETLKKMGLSLVKLGLYDLETY
jgi:hypothetical protein